MREHNFRMGRGRIRELRRSFYPGCVEDTLEWLSPWSLRVLRYQLAMSARTL